MNSLRRLSTRASKPGPWSGAFLPRRLWITLRETARSSSATARRRCPRLVFGALCLALGCLFSNSSEGATVPGVDSGSLYPQLGLGGMAAGKILQQFHLPSSPTDLLEFVLEYFLKQKIGNTLPLNLNAKDSYPTVENAALPGGPFHGKALSSSASSLRTALAPGDYILPVTAYCTQYSVHRAGQGTAYKLAPVEGTQADAISTLLWRGTLAGRSPQELQATNWAIQAGVTYSAMPKPYQALIDQLIPDYRDRLKGNMLEVVESTYRDITVDPRKYVQAYLREHYKANVPLMMLPKIAVPAPPLDVVLAKIGPPGLMLLDAKKQSTIFLTAYTSKERGEQVLFEGQGECLPAEPAAEGPWTVRVPGTAYMRFIVQGGNMQGNNLMQIRIVSNAPAALAQSRPRLVEASYAVISPGPTTLPATSVYGLLGVRTAGSSSTTAVDGDLNASGVITYPQGGEGSQALMPVAVSSPGLQATPLQQIANQDIHRTVIGLGEIVRISKQGADGNSSWSIDHSTLGKLFSRSATQVMFRALDMPGTVTIGDGASQIELTILAPESVVWAPVVPAENQVPTLHSHGKCDVFVDGFYYLGPATVSFSRLRLREKNVFEELTGTFARFKPMGHCTEDTKAPGFCTATGVSTIIQPKYGSREYGIDGASFYGGDSHPEVCGQNANGTYTLNIPLAYNVLDTDDLKWSKAQLAVQGGWTPDNKLIGTTVVQQLTTTEGVLSMQKGALPPVPTVQVSSPDNVLACLNPDGSKRVVPGKAATARGSCTDLCTWQGQGKAALCDGSASAK